MPCPGIRTRWTRALAAARGAHVFATPQPWGSLLRQGETGGRAHAVLQGIAGLQGCQFWADDLSYADIELSEVSGHRQVTDSYLAALARSRDGGLLATLDEALSARLSEHCVLLPRLA